MGENERSGDAIAEEEHRCCFNSLNFRTFCLFVLVIDAYVLPLVTLRSVREVGEHQHENGSMEDGMLVCHNNIWCISI